MSISYEDTGRTKQKSRTRAALIAAARQLLAQGRTPTVEQAAAAASISRATAYRYFANQRALLVAAHPEVEAPSLLGPEPPTDPEARLDLVVTGLADIFIGAEETYRTMLRLSLESGNRGELALREGRRLLWIDDAIVPLRDRLPADTYQRLVNALAAAVGIEALVALTDLARLSHQEAVTIMRWSARALL
ncbi:MAG TPA: TetR family transcriptional regulator, partial [Solirubrobacterales bacterium]